MKHTIRLTELLLIIAVAYGATMTVVHYQDTALLDKSTAQTSKALILLDEAMALADRQTRRPLCPYL